MSQIFPLILNKKNEIRNYFDKFTKNFTTELQYMEIIIRLDAKKMSNSSCCSSFKLDSLEEEQKIVINRANKFDKNFCNAFNMMDKDDRQSYFLELLDMIHLLINEFSLIMQRKIKRQEKCTQHDLKNYQRELKDKFFSKYVYKNLEDLMNHIYLLTFVIKTQINSIIADKIVRFDNFTIHLIQKVKKEETKLIIDIRNYMILKLTSNEYMLQSLYSTIVPTSIKIKLLSMEERDKMIPLMYEIAKIGKIERLLLNFQIQKIVKESIGVIAQVSKSGILSSSFIKPAVSINQFEDEFSSNMYWRNTIKAGQLTKMHLLKKKTLQQTKYQQMKKNLIQILNKLAAKKIQENERIDAFLSKKLKIKQKVKTDTVYAALKDRQSILFPLNGSYDHKNSLLMKQSLLMEAIIKELPPPDSETLKVMGKKIDNKDQLSDDHSFLSNNKQDETRQRNDLSQFVSRQDSSIKFQQCLYYELYPQYKLAPTDILSEYAQVEINEKNWINSVPKITDHFDSSLRKQKFKINYLEIIKANCKIFKHRQIEYKFKIFMQQNIDLRFLVEAISDIESWPKWHPNVDSVKLISKNQSRNSCEYLIICYCLKTKFQYHFIIHLFQIRRKYFLVFKSVINTQKSKRKNSILHFFKSIKIESTREVVFFMLKMQNIGNQTNKRLSRIVFDYSIHPSEANQFVLSQALTLILNFYFIATYWKVQENKPREIEANPNTSQMQINRILSTNWNVSPQIYDNELYHQ